MIVENLEDAEDVMEEISIEDITKNMPRLAKAVEFDSAGGGCKLVKKTKERLEAKKRLRGNDGEELKVAKRDFAKQKEEVKSQENHSRDAESEEQACWLSSTFL